jgi:hypothetical protein
MNKSEFEELVNLYLDREISVVELERLQEELSASDDRRREFQRRYRLHRATCSALSFETATISGQTTSAAQTPYFRRHTPSLFSGLGIAACFLFVFAISLRIMRDPVDKLDTVIVKTAEPIDQVQYPETQETTVLSSQGSLSSQLRLAGLTPDIAPSDQQLSTVDAEAIRRREAHLQDVIEKVNDYKMYTAIPNQQLVGSSERNYEAPSNSYWPSDFKSSLAVFR